MLPTPTALTCYASAVMEMGEFLCASKSYDSTCYASAMIEMGEYRCVLPNSYRLQRVLRLCVRPNSYRLSASIGIRRQ